MAAGNFKLLKGLDATIQWPSIVKITSRVRESGSPAAELIKA